MSNSADTEFVFGEKSWIEWNLVPISKSPSCFQTHVFAPPPPLNRSNCDSAATLKRQGKPISISWVKR